MMSNCNPVPPLAGRPASFPTAPTPRRLGSRTSHEPSPLAVLSLSSAIALLWLIWSLVEASERSGTFYIGSLLFLAWMFAWLAMFGLVAFLLGYGAVSLVRRDFSRAVSIAASLVVLTLALGTFVLAVQADLPLRARFEASEGALNRFADDYVRHGATGGSIDDWAGLYHVYSVYPWENCVVIITGTFFLDESGFARCDGIPPADHESYIEVNHLKGDWWTFEHRD